MWDTLFSECHANCNATLTPEACAPTVIDGVAGRGGGSGWALLLLMLVLVVA